LCGTCSIYALQLREPVGRIGKNSQAEAYVPPTNSFSVLNNKNNIVKDEVQNKNSELQNSDTKNNQKLSLLNSQSKQNFLKDEEAESIVREIAGELDTDIEVMLNDLKELWVCAVENSETIRFAIIKLSNPNGEEVNKSGFKKIVAPIISAAPLLGQGLANPAAAAGSLIGSGVLSSVLNDNSELNARLTKVNDADLVILAKAIDDLQQNLVVNYMSYIGAYKEYEYSMKITAERQAKYEELNKNNSSNLLLANTFYTEALDNQYKARQAFLMKRIVLEQMVGNDALVKIEQRLNSNGNGNQNPNPNPKGNESENNN
jgi:hypothetical protein